MRSLLFLPLLAVASIAPAETPAPSTLSLPLKAPSQGQPFDDRVIVALLEKEGRKLLKQGRLKPLKSAPRRCTFNVGAARNDKAPLTDVASKAEAATVVIGEFYKDGKKKDLQFSSAAGGFFIGDKGLLLTSLHVVSEKESRGFVVMTRDGKVYPVREAIAADPVDDLVVLQLDVPDDMVFPSLPLATDLPSIGSSVAVLSHPDEHFWLLTTGVVGRHTVWHGASGDEHYMSITADFAKGSSGCPVLDERGNVVGIVNNTQSVYYDDDGKKKQLDLQMVVKNATPSWCARALFQP